MTKYKITYETVNLDEDGSILDVLDGEFNSVELAQKSAEVSALRFKDDWPKEPQLETAIREVTRKILPHTIKQW